MKTWINKIVQLGGLITLLSCNQPVDVVTIDLSREEQRSLLHYMASSLKKSLILAMEVYMRK